MAIQLEDYQNVTNPERDGISYKFLFSRIQNNKKVQPDEKVALTQYKVVVNCSRTLSAVWNLKEENLLKVLYCFARDELSKKVDDGFSEREITIDLHTGNSSQDCPYDPAQIEFPNPDPY